MECLRQDFASLFSEGVAPDTDTTPSAVRRRRDAVFRETLPEAAIRTLHHSAAWMSPRTVGWLVQRLKSHRDQPVLPSFAAIAAASGDLCGPVADLSAAALFDLYARGLYVEPLGGLLAWRAPNFRHIADLCPSYPVQSRDETGWRVTFDCDFDRILATCARPGRDVVHASGGPTWFAPQLLNAFAELFDAGLAHSFEIVAPSGEIVTRGYGIAIGRIFVTEAWFSSRTGAGAIGLCHLNRRLAQWGYVLNDIKTRRALTFEPWERRAYMRALVKNLAGGRYGHWRQR
jgi:Leu/Phe-tRNA-protein transferase